MPAVIGSPIAASNLGHFDGLDDFSLMSIFDLLDASELVKLAQFSPRFHKIILDHYIIGKYRLQERNILITVTDTVTIKYKTDYKWIPLIKENYDISLVVLQLFGEAFTNLNIQINYQIGYTIVEGVQAAVNKHCTNAFQKVEVLHYYCHNDSQKVNVSFPNATDIVVSARVYVLRSPFNLDLAFPKMQKLKIDCSSDQHAHYPHLTELIFGLDYQHPKQYESYVSQLVQMNPQLRRIKTPGFNFPTYFEHLSELPNLEILTVGLLSRYYYDSEFTTARFRKVKEFSLDVDEFRNGTPYLGFPEALLDSIQFDLLESFSLTMYDTDNEQKTNFLIGMIVRNAELQKVTINSNLHLDYALKLVEKLSHLRELNIVWHKHSSGLALNRFLSHIVEKNHTLERFNVRFPVRAEVLIEGLLEFIPQGWRYIEAGVSSKWLQLERSA